MAKQKSKFSDVIQIPETCTSAAIDSITHMSTQKKHVIMMFAKEAEELSEEGNGILLSDEEIKEKFPSQNSEEDYVELELSEKQKSEMKEYKDFTEITRIRDLSELSDALSEAGCLLYVQNNSSFTFLNAMTQAFLFEAEHGHRSRHEADSGVGKSYFAYCLRILVPNRISEEIYSALASFALRFFCMEKHIYAVFAERKGSGTYIRIIVTARQFYPEGIEKKRFATSRTVRNLETGRIRNLKADAEVPENCIIIREKGDLMSCETVFFGNKDGGFAVSKRRFNTILEKFKKNFRTKLKTIGYAVSPKFCFSKINESDISKTALATHHAACVINDTLNYVENAIEDFRENTAMYGFFISDEDIYKEVYKPFYDKIQQFISSGKPVVSYLERETYDESEPGGIRTMKFPYFFSLVAKYAKNAVYASMARFVSDFEMALQRLKKRVFGEEIKPLEDSAIFYVEMEKKEDDIRGIRPRLKKIHDKLEEAYLRRKFGRKNKSAQEELEEEYQEYLSEIMEEEAENEEYHADECGCDCFNKKGGIEQNPSELGGISEGVKFRHFVFFSENP